MSRTYRAPPPRRRLRAGYVKRPCWRCLWPVAVCDCPARALVVMREQPEGDLSDEASVPDWCCRCVAWCSCASDLPIASPPLTQPLAALLVA